MEKPIYLSVSTLKISKMKFVLPVYLNSNDVVLVIFGQLLRGVSFKGIKINIS